MTGSTGLEPATSGLTERDALGCTASPKWCNLLISHGEQWEITRTALLDLVGPNRGGLEGRGHGRKHPRRCNRKVNFRDGQRVETGTGFAREAGCLFRIPFEVSALQPRRRITPPLRKALLVQIGGPQCTVGKHSDPPSNSVSGCGSSAAARLDALCGQPPALTSVHSFSTYTQLSTNPESHGVTRSRGLRARKTTVDSPTASTNAKNTPFNGVTSASRRVHKASDADKRSIYILDRGILS